MREPQISIVDFEHEAAVSTTNYEAVRRGEELLIIVLQWIASQSLSQ